MHDLSQNTTFTKCITAFVTPVARLVTPEEQELLTLLEHLHSAMF